MTNKKNLFLIGIIVLIAIVLVGGYLLRTRGVRAEIINAVMSRSIDAKGNATGVATVFDSKADKVVYAVLTLKNTTRKTKISYVRYLNGKYVDSKVASPSTDGVTNFYFTFEKGIGNYPKGNYKLVFYADGRRSVELPFVFQ